MRQQWKSFLEHQHLPWFLALLSVGLCSRSLWLGWYADDHVHRASFTRAAEFPELARSPFNIFAFITGDSQANLDYMTTGLLP